MPTNKLEIAYFTSNIALTVKSAKSTGVHVYKFFCKYWANSKFTLFNIYTKFK